MDSRDNWDNLSHGPTFTEQTAELIAYQEKQLKIEAEEEERKKTEEAKAKSEKASSKNAGKPKEEDKKGADKSSGDSADKKPIEKQKEEESKPAPDGNQTLGEGEKKEDKDPDAGAKGRDKLPTDKDAKTNSGNKGKTPPIKPNRRRDDNSKMRDLEKAAWKSFEDCQNICLERPDCFQFVLYQKSCKLGLSFRLGKYVAPDFEGRVMSKSGWMVDRIRKWTEVNACHGPEWPDIR